jgi:hypothetical protein
VPRPSARAGTSRTRACQTTSFTIRRRDAPWGVSGAGKTVHLPRSLDGGGASPMSRNTPALDENTSPRNSPIGPSRPTFPRSSDKTSSPPPSASPFRASIAGLRDQTSPSRHPLGSRCSNILRRCGKRARIHITRARFAATSRGIAATPPRCLIQPARLVAPWPDFKTKRACEGIQRAHVAATRRDVAAKLRDVASNEPVASSSWLMERRQQDVSKP